MLPFELPISDRISACDARKRANDGREQVKDALTARAIHNDALVEDRFTPRTDNDETLVCSISHTTALLFLIAERLPAHSIVRDVDINAPW